MARPSSLWLQLDRIAQRLAEAASLAVCCDFDGTLTPIAERPSDVELNPRTKAALEDLATAANVNLAIISGRGLNDLAAHAPIPNLFLAGCCGLETREASGHEEKHTGSEDKLPDAAVHDFELWCKRFPGAWVEHKGLSLALHCRAVSPPRRLAFAAGVLRRVRALADRVALTRGKMVFEIMPATAKGKNQAIDQWLAVTPPNAVVFYLGDDTNDEAVFARLRSAGEITIAVARERSAAEYRVDSTDEVVWFLEWLAREWAWRSGAQSANGSTPGAERAPVSMMAQGAGGRDRS
jgi:trehalose 6-phosphate phosphatase